MLNLKLFARLFLHQPRGVLPDDAPRRAFLSLPKRGFKRAFSVPRQTPTRKETRVEIVVPAMMEKNATKPLIERIRQDVKAEIRRRSEQHSETANVVDPFVSQPRDVSFTGQRRRNTSRDAPFNLAGSAGSRIYLSD